MSDGAMLSAGDFGLAFKSFLEQSIAQATPSEPFFRPGSPNTSGRPRRALPILAEQFASHDHPNLQLAIDSHLADTAGRSSCWACRRSTGR